MTEEKADQIIRSVKECWWRVLLVIAIPVFLIALLLRGWPVSVTLEDGMAAWVQAVGTLIALTIAIAVPIWQNRKVEERFENEARSASWRTLRLLWLLTDKAKFFAESEGGYRSDHDNSLSPQRRDIARRRFDEIVTEIFNVSLSSVDNGEALHYVMKVRGIVLDAQKELQKDPYPDAMLRGGEALGLPWIRIYGELSDAEYVLRRHAEARKMDLDELVFTPW